ncbi:lysine-N-methylase [Clostridium cavendishii DSM 21758]|uniref:Lysine-N-methylase n=1 Tax=Clostridium cavendishii DSM 21758 TaxID=1121302 RepID=A0A1M6HKJ8_9CLOT|nr:lysine-N-methylase [Clostridium cavendishii DSM 21758]
MDKETSEDCPCLDKQGLCQIVKSHGEGHLSLTCHTFPRIENVFEDRKELSLSCACPEAVRLIDSINGKIGIASENNTDLADDLLELKIREAIINIINTDKFLLEHKLILSFEMLLNILEGENLEEDTIVKQIEIYK